MFIINNVCFRIKFSRNLIQTLMRPQYHRQQKWKFSRAICCNIHLCSVPLIVRALEACYEERISREALSIGSRSNYASKLFKVKRAKSSGRFFESFADSTWGFDDSADCTILKIGASFVFNPRGPPRAYATPICHETFSLHCGLHNPPTRITIHNFFYSVSQFLFQQSF